MFRDTDKKSLEIFGMSLVMVLFLHFFAIYTALYSELWWFDDIVHFLAGMTMGAFFVFTLSKIRNKKLKDLISIKIGRLLSVIIFAFTIGFLWEIKELITKTSFSVEGYYLDTIADLCEDMLGAVLAYLIII